MHHRPAVDQQGSVADVDGVVVFDADMRTAQGVCVLAPQVAVEAPLLGCGDVHLAAMARYQMYCHAISSSSETKVPTS